MVEVLMYSTATCPFCQASRSLLQGKGVAFTEIRVDESPDQRLIMRTKSGGRYTVPQIFINNQHIGGFDDLARLESEGRLNELLKL